VPFAVPSKLDASHAVGVVFEVEYVQLHCFCMYWDAVDDTSGGHGCSSVMAWMQDVVTRHLVLCHDQECIGASCLAQWRLPLQASAVPMDARGQLVCADQNDRSKMSGPK
jgi:hypothetical protein